MNEAGTLQEFAFSAGAGGIGLTAGQQYVSFLSISNLAPQPAVSLGCQWQQVVHIGLSGEGFVYQDTGTQFLSTYHVPMELAFGATGLEPGLKRLCQHPPLCQNRPACCCSAQRLVGLVAWRWKQAA